MPEIQHLTRAPILEAIVDIQCVWGTDLSPEQAIDRLKGCQSAIASEFPKVETRQLQQFMVTPESQPTVTQFIEGFLCRSDNEPAVVQLMRQRFSFSRLSPYENWEGLRERSRKFWDIYQSVVGEMFITRIAVRYINKIQIPYPLSGGENLIKQIPIPLTSPANSSNVSAFVTQVMSTDTTGATVGVVHALQPVVPGSLQAELILDIDVFRSVNNLTPSNSQIWETLNSFQDVKNRVFFGAIGQAIVDKYK